MERVNNTVRLKLWKGNVIVAGRKGPNSLTASTCTTSATRMAILHAAPALGRHGQPQVAEKESARRGWRGAGSVRVFRIKRS